MSESIIKIVADFDKIAENIQSIGEDLKSPELTKEDKKSIKNDLDELIEKMKEVRDNFKKD